MQTNRCLFLANFNISKIFSSRCLWAMGPLNNRFELKLLIKDPRACIQRPRNLLEMLQFPKMTCIVMQTYI